MVTTYKTTKEETQSFFEWNDLAGPIIDTMGIDMWDTIQILKYREIQDGMSDAPSEISYIEDGIFANQIDESGVIEELIKKVILDLTEQGYIKKNKSIDNFEYNDVLYREIIDEKLSPGIMNYFRG